MEITNVVTSRNEEEFKKKMVLLIKSNYANILDDEDIKLLDQGDLGLDLLIKKYFSRDH